MLEESACVLWGWNELHKENKYVKNVRWTCWQEQEDWRESRGAVQLVQLQVAQTPLSDHRCYGLEAWRPLRPRILHIKEAASVVEQAWWQELSHATTCSGAAVPPVQWASSASVSNSARLMDSSKRSHRDHVAGGGGDSQSEGQLGRQEVWSILGQYIVDYLVLSLQSWVNYVIWQIN